MKQLARKRAYSQRLAFASLLEQGEGAGKPPPQIVVARVVQKWLFRQRAQAVHAVIARVDVALLPRRSGYKNEAALFHHH
ncbi:MAG: hypothetical protein BWY96_02391 [Spirochaetes bacterium ADurb.BinA120]|nr:MAG: hypothetical protein BWY96_02391 [Spirochaetes bacterium ADurb.BinA120]